ncbi:hypothetical protein FKM82_025701 [Ascaphus truei]
MLRCLDPPTDPPSGPPSPLEDLPPTKSTSPNGMMSPGRVSREREACWVQRKSGRRLGRSGDPEAKWFSLAGVRELRRRGDGRRRGGEHWGQRLRLDCRGGIYIFTGTPAEARDSGRGGRERGS